MKKFIAPLFMLFVATGCASHVYVPYPYPQAEAEVGRVIIQLTEPMRTVHVQIDGALVAENKYTRRVEIQQEPVGQRELQVAASEYWRTQPVHHTQTIEVQPNRDVTILLTTPPYSSGYWAFVAVLTIVTFAPTIFVF